MQRGAALLFASVPLFGSLVQIFGAWLALTLCTQNCDDQWPSAADLILTVGAAGVVFLTALAFWLLVAFNRGREATIAFVVHLATAAALLLVWTHASDASDDTLVAVTLGCEVFGLLALLLCRGEYAQRQRLETSSSRS